MARENQGLQIALIVFFMLTIILGVTTFIFFRQYDEAYTKATTAQKDAADQGAAARIKTDEGNKLKEMLGFAATQNLDEITAKRNEDMTTYAATIAEENRNYRNLVIYLAQAMQAKNTELDGLKIENQKLKDDLVALEATKRPKVEEAEKRATDAAAQLAAVTETSKALEDRMTKENAGYKTQLADARKKADTDVAAVEQNLEGARAKIATLGDANKDLSVKLRGVLKETFDVPDGEIRWVSQQQRTVWINLGRADAVSRQITFAVYPVDTTNLAKAVIKAKIEVTQILGEHLAEARILEDDISNPIMPGDKINTAVWSAGEQKRFALAGFMDLDGDGKSDRKTVHDLIAMNGGVVDCELDESGNKQGRMDVTTRYLVLGAAPDVKNVTDADKLKDLKKLTESYSAMRSEADGLGIETITLDDLLQRMGWKRQTPVIQFGRGANPNDFRAKPAEGVPKISRGNVSEIFRERRPPVKKAPAPGGKGGAY